MKHIYISLPMDGKSKKEIGTYLKDINQHVKEKAHNKFGWDVNDIQTIDNFWDHLFPDNEEMLTKGERIIHLGSGVRKLAEADAVYFNEGWEESKECLVTRVATSLYSIPVIFYDEVIDICKEEKEDEE